MTFQTISSLLDQCNDAVSPFAPQLNQCLGGIAFSAFGRTRGTGAGATAAEEKLKTSALKCMTAGVL